MKDLHGFSEPLKNDRSELSRTNKAVFTPAKLKRLRPSRAKRYVVWERIETESEGRHSINLCILIKRFPKLTPMELRIATLIKGGMSTSEILIELSLCEKTVENHRYNIRKKLGLVDKENLQTYLIQI